MNRNIPPIVKVAERLQLEVERAVARFARSFKYTLGSDLRSMAMDIAMLSHRAWREPDMRSLLLAQLVGEVDQMKLCLQLGSRLHAFSSFGQFEQIARTARELGQQVGGWKRANENHPNGQNAASSTQPQRPKKLSSRNASICEANA